MLWTFIQSLEMIYWVNRLLKQLHNGGSFANFQLAMVSSIVSQIILNKINPEFMKGIWAPVWLPRCRVCLIFNTTQRIKLWAALKSFVSNLLTKIKLVKLSSEQCPMPNVWRFLFKVAILCWLDAKEDKHQLHFIPPPQVGFQANQLTEGLEALLSEMRHHAANSLMSQQKKMIKAKYSLNFYSSKIWTESHHTTYK